ncbi:hypothetical protein ENC_22670 [Enterobacter hormaechei]|nr:hypothetical protein ENC_22670 [Enterobacter hormaechei]
MIFSEKEKGRKCGLFIM